ncbi:ESCRT-II complex, vps25 subunit [Patellaria atrata CBS 101060]|uniref:Vacuolar protein-sorting-associated protein 25 n=1 Tax=Patellaria atrata CBS 101060 TaxID=1346257 RepID=A0A9P4SIN3_9PEZI|nr:ESCRT-II complex, vps25 subunit [Patellaria atrata CBS 101060]
MSTEQNPKPFHFPPHHSFPPFFTLQPTSSTRASQLSSWSALILSYCAHHRLFSLRFPSALALPLFCNEGLGRRLRAGDVKAVLAWMGSAEGGGRVEWVDGGGKKGVGTGTGEGEILGEEGLTGRCWVFWRRAEEWAAVVEEWVERTGQKGVVLTLYEIGEGEGTAGEEFHGMDGELLRRVLGVVVKRGRAQVFGEGDGLGVKFF